MIVKSLNDVIGTDADVRGPGWNSRRLVLKGDGLGYSVTNTVIEAGAEMTLEYKNHFESCYCITGTGSIHDTATGQTHKISPGTIYALNNNDHHTLKADKSEDMYLVCVFTPPLTGNEIHQADGSYAVDD